MEMSKKSQQLFSSLISYNFINSQASGYLEKKSETWFSGGWTEKFCVLTNVGMLYYEDPQKRPNNLFPTIDAEIVKIPEGKYSRKYVF